MKRDDLIKALNRLKIETGSIACLGCGHEHNCATQGCAIIRAAVEELETAAPPWIPVTENEPPTNTTLLLSVRDPSFGLLYTTAGYQGARWHDIFDLLPIDQERITHWMLLPEPPEVSENG